MTEAVSAPPPKLDPETLVIRGKPRRAIRFRRGVIIGIAALGSASLMTVAWVALKPQVFRHVANQEDMAQPNTRPASDTLNGVPATYGDAPKLGPPLPGDLGRPILDHQRALAIVTQPAASATPDRPTAAVDAEARRAAERQAARQSGVMMQRASDRGADAPTRIVEAAPVMAGVGPQVVADPAQEPSAQPRKIDFVTAPQGDRNPFAIVDAPSPYTLSAGSILSASLITGLDSDLPGLVTAQVTENAYDTVTGRILLVPQGARLIGSYDSVVAFGQRRALVVWQRILFPDGSSVRLENWPTSDASGYAGLADKLDLHTWQLLKGVALSTLLGAGTELSFTGESDLVQALRESTQQNAARAGDQLVAKNLSVQPTIRVRPGWPLRVIVHKDLILRPH